jgi:hypothetical protein
MQMNELWLVYLGVPGNEEHLGRDARSSALYFSQVPAQNKSVI